MSVAAAQVGRGRAAPPRLASARQRSALWVDEALATPDGVARRAGALLAGVDAGAGVPPFAWAPLQKRFMPSSSHILPASPCVRLGATLEDYLPCMPGW